MNEFYGCAVVDPIEDSLSDIITCAMPPRESDQKWIKEAIEEAFKKHSKKWEERLKTFSLPSISVALLIFFVTQYGTYVEFRTHTNDRLDSIEANVRLLLASKSPQKVLQDLSSLPPREFPKNLPALQVASEQTTIAVHPSRKDLTKIASELTKTDPASDDYWPATLAFVSFATQSLTEGVPPPSLTGMHLSDIHGNPNSPNGGIIGFDNKVLFLDGGSVSDITIRNSRLIFGSESVKLVNVHLVNCVLEFPVRPESPTPYIQDVAKSVLASDFTNVFIGSLG